MVQMAKDTEARMSEFALYHNSRIEDTAQAGPEDLLQNRHNVCDSTLMRSGTVPFGFIASSAAPVSLKISRNSHGGQSPREAMQSAAARNDPNMFQSTVSVCASVLFSAITQGFCIILTQHAKFLQPIFYGHKQDCFVMSGTMVLSCCCDLI